MSARAFAMLQRPRRSKYNAVPTTVAGVRFASRAEALLNGMLETMRCAGDVLYFLRQVPLHLPGGVTYRIDFQVFYRDGRVRYLDAKGMETAMFKTKKKLVEALYPIKIETVRRERSGRLAGL